MINIPNLLLIGAPKCGTTALAENLNQHSAIFVPEIKEPRYFDHDTFYGPNSLAQKISFEQYQSYYDGINCDYRMDGSVFNMYDERSIKSILEVSPDAKFILMIRDPLAATKSMFKQRLKYMNPQMRELSDDFEEVWELSKERVMGKNYPVDCNNKFLFRYDLLYSYENYLPYIIKLIKPENLFIGAYSDFKSEPAHFCSRIFEFLALSDLTVENRTVNESSTVELTKRTLLIYFVVKKLQFVRKHLSNWLPGVENKIKDMLFKRTKKVILGSGADEDIRQFFSSTYDYCKRNNFRF